MKSIVILMQNGIGDTTRLYTLLLALRKDESLSMSDQKYVQEMIKKHLDNKQSESHDDGYRF
ncbi:MAG: hypothetical protein ACYDAJ_08225 [Nitrosotalea sp.]